MTERQHAADSVPDEDTSSGTRPAPAAEKEPRATELPRRFRRDRRHKMLAGVCAGLGRQCDMDPVIFRITLAVLSATGGIGLLFYGFAWLFVPYDGEDENEVRKLFTGRVDGQALTAVLFALVGCGVFLTLLNNGGVLTFAVVLSLLLAGAGYWSRHRGAPDTDPLAAQAVADAPPEAQAPPVPAAYPSWWRDPIVKDGTHVGGTGYLWGPRDSRDRDIDAAVNISLGTTWAGRQDIRTPPERAPRPRGPRWIGGRVFVLALLAGGLGTGATWEEQTLGTSLQTGLACALIVLGVGIAVSAFLGRTGAGSIFLAIITAGLLAASTALPKNIGTDWVRTTWRPAAVADVQRKYDLGTGVGTLDLTRLRWGKGQSATLVESEVEVGVGRVRVVVPPDITVKLNIDVGVGDIQLPGDKQKDVDVKPGRYKQVTLPPSPGVKSAGTVDLDLQVGVGQAEVSRATS
ncbi:phage shock protein PspC (stress-responsive transcriptional regulator) [Streptomyces sp. LBL]|uniref:PspC domain-containing protein n=1 Tax=Streptomyces sp. LBL TaxID=2940562 RepID=UPI0024745AE3|nr:PspC domain-containing protein [Streptomyces sp. LBL]MDH6623646.1 phage shock protein PspC (stress-responsive transcriptional regulator) [Streptomyces sp. LBL]